MAVALLLAQVPFFCARSSTSTGPGDQLDQAIKTMRAGDFALARNQLKKIADSPDSTSPSGRRDCKVYALLCLGDVERSLENYKLSVEYYQQALAAAENRYGTDSCKLIPILECVWHAKEHLNRTGDSAVLLRRLIELKRQSEGLDAPNRNRLVYLTELAKQTTSVNERASVKREILAELIAHPTYLEFIGLNNQILQLFSTDVKELGPVALRAACLQTPITRKNFRSRISMMTCSYLILSKLGDTRNAEMVKQKLRAAVATTSISLAARVEESLGCAHEICQLKNAVPSILDEAVESAVFKEGKLRPEVQKQIDELHALTVSYRARYTGDADQALQSEKELFDYYMRINPARALSCMRDILETYLARTGKITAATPLFKKIVAASYAPTAETFFHLINLAESCERGQLPISEDVFEKACKTLARAPLRVRLSCLEQTDFCAKVWSFARLIANRKHFAKCAVILADASDALKDIDRPEVPDERLHMLSKSSMLALWVEDDVLLKNNIAKIDVLQATNPRFDGQRTNYFIWDLLITQEERKQASQRLLERCKSAVEAQHCLPLAVCTLCYDTIAFADSVLQADSIKFFVEKLVEQRARIKSLKCRPWERETDYIYGRNLYLTGRQSQAEPFLRLFAKSYAAPLFRNERCWAIVCCGQVYLRNREFYKLERAAIQLQQFENDPFSQMSANYQLAMCAWHKKNNVDAAKFFKRAIGWRDKMPATFLWVEPAPEIMPQYEKFRTETNQ